MRAILFIILYLTSFHVIAKDPPDSTAVAKLYGTSWTLSERYVIRKGIFHRAHKDKEPPRERITIYKDEIHVDITGGPYQVCPMRHRNGNEFWLDCRENDQLIYRIIEIKGDELVMDILTKPYGESKYMRTARKYYKRYRNPGSKYLRLSPMKARISFLPVPLSADVRK